MANKTSKDLGLKIDNASQALTDISANVNQQDLERATTILDDTAVGDTAHTTLYGLLQAPRLTLNGWVNTTVEAIFGPLLVSGTGVTKTAQFQLYSTRFIYGEFNFENVRFSGSPDTLQTWSATLVGAGGLNRTSVTQA